MDEFDPEEFKTLTVEAFRQRYYYASDLKMIAKALGHAGVSRARKDQLEAFVEGHLRGGPRPAKKRAAATMSSRKDSDSPLTARAGVVNYTSNRVTKSFLLAEAQRRHPGFRSKSGQWYWLNRWREENMEQSRAITYGDLVNELIRLSQVPGRLPQIPSARRNNFVSDFLADGAGSKDEAAQAWRDLKALPIQKTYAAWKEWASQNI